MTTLLICLLVSAIAFLVLVMPALILSGQISREEEERRER